MSLPTPNYVLTESVEVWVRGCKKILEVGSFVRPISDSYLPAHIKETNAYRWHNPENTDYCYTSYGIVEIPTCQMRRV